MPRKSSRRWDTLPVTAGSEMISATASEERTRINRFEADPAEPMPKRNPQLVNREAKKRHRAKSRDKVYYRENHHAIDWFFAAFRWILGAYACMMLAMISAVLAFAPGGAHWIAGIAGFLIGTGAALTMRYFIARAQFIHLDWILSLTIKGLRVQKPESIKYNLDGGTKNYPLVDIGHIEILPRGLIRRIFFKRCYDILIHTKSQENDKENMLRNIKDAPRLERAILELQERIRTGRI